MYIAEKIEEFTGREWVFEKINSWLDDPDGARVFLLTGGPGTGKSAVAARLAQMSLGKVGAKRLSHLGKGSLTYYHFCQAQSGSTLNPLRFVEALSGALANRFQPFADALLQVPHRDITVIQDVGTAETGSHVTGIAIQSVQVGNLSARTAFDWAVQPPLEALYKTPFDETILVLVDSMDEALAYNPEENIPQLLADAMSSPQNLPVKVRFLFTSRPDPRVLRLIGEPSLDLVADAPRDIDDVRDYSIHRLNAMPEPAKAELVDRIAAASNGNFLYAHYVLDDLIARPEVLANPATLELPKGLDDVYRQFISRELARNEERWSERYRPLLGLLAVARSPGLTRDHLSAGSGLPQSKTDDTLAACIQYLTGPLPNGPFMLYHQSFREFLLEDAKYSVYPMEAEQTIGELFLQAYGEDWRTCEDSYALLNTPGHLARAAGALTQPLKRKARCKLEDELSGLLLDFNWLQAKLKAADIAAVIADYELLPTVPKVGLVRDTLRLSAHLLTRDKTQLAGQLIGRLQGRSENVVPALLEQATHYHDAPWLHPLTCSLEGPGGSLQRTMIGHSSGINGLTLTPDGQRLVSASSDSTLKVWNLESGVCERTLTGHGRWVSAVAITPDGTRAISASWDRTLKIWDLRTGALERTLSGHEGPVLSVAVTPDGCWAVSGSSDKTIKIWDIRPESKAGIEVDAPLSTLTGHIDEVNAVVVTPDGKRILSASRDHTLKLWHISADPDSGQIREENTTLGMLDRAVTSVAVTPDGKYAVSGSADKSRVMVWDLETGNVKTTLKGHTLTVFAVAVTPDGRYAVSGSMDSTLKIWDLGKGLEKNTISNEGWINAVAITPDGRYVVSGSMDGIIKVWDMGKEEKKVLKGYWIIAVAISPDGRYAISGSIDGIIKVWSRETGKEKIIPKECSNKIKAVAITSDGKNAVLVLSNSVFKIWDLEKGEGKTILEVHDYFVEAAAVTPDGKYAILCLTDGIIKVWNLEKGEEKTTLKGHNRRVDAVAITPDGKYAVSTSSSLDGKLKVWDLEKGEEKITLKGQRYDEVKFIEKITPKGRYLKWISTEWYLEKGEEKITLIGYYDRVTAVAITPDGKYAISASDDRTLNVLNLENGEEKIITVGHNRDVTAVVITPDGKYAVSASSSIFDYTLEVWNLENGENVSNFTGDNSFRTCNISSDGEIIAASDFLGRMHFFHLETPY